MARVEDYRGNALPAAGSRVMARDGVPENVLRMVGLEPKTNGLGDDEARYAVTSLRRFLVISAPPPFPTDALPASVARLVRESSVAIGCPPDSVGLAALVTLGAAIGNSRVIQPKKGWTESATIFAAVIADAGEKKTAAVKVATGPARKLESSLQREHELRVDEYSREQREYEVEKKQAARDGAAAPPPPRPPTAERIRINDTTAEALIPILKENPRGLLLERDELVGWVKGMDQYKPGGKGSERQLWLSAWSNEPTSVDRKGEQGTTNVLKPFVGVIGSIQPDVLSELAENREDGMLERFLFAYPKTLNALWTDAEISEGAVTAYRDLYNSLRSLPMQKDEQDDPMDIPVTFEPGAKEAYIDHYNAHRSEMGTLGFPDHLRSVWAKLEAYTLRLTLILACCRFAENEEAQRIETSDVLAAVVLTDYFKEQARRVFGALRGYDPKKVLLQDVASFVKEAGGTWSGTPTELRYTNRTTSAVS